MGKIWGIFGKNWEYLGKIGEYLGKNGGIFGKKMEEYLGKMGEYDGLTCWSLQLFETHVFCSIQVDANGRFHQQRWRHATDCRGPGRSSEIAAFCSLNHVLDHWCPAAELLVVPTYSK